MGEIEDFYGLGKSESEQRRKENYNFIEYVAIVGLVFSLYGFIGGKVIKDFVKESLLERKSNNIVAPINLNSDTSKCRSINYFQ
jgi:hypothetical protein